jgi:hypothetical protein
LNKFIVGVLALLVAVVGFGSMSAPAANADVDDVVAIGCQFLIAGIDGDLDDVSTSTGADGTAACGGLTNTGDNAASTAVETGGEIETLAETLGDADGTLEASDLEDIDLDANQIRDGAAANPSAGLYLFIFVTDDEPVTIDFNALATDVADCTGFGSDEDCDDDNTAGDGVLLAVFGDATGDGGSVEEGETVDVVVTSDGADTSEEINIVGAPDDIVVTPLKTVVQTLSDDEACDDIEVTDALDANEDADKVAIVAVVTDNDGTELTRVGVSFESSDEDVLAPAEDEKDDGSVDSTTGITVESDSGNLAAAVFCGQDETGTVEVTAEFDDTAAGGEVESDTAEVTVVGGAENITLTASPAAIACDGTASSTVTAVVTDGDGNNVADGTTVNFSVVALGTANPINASTTDGEASSTITPLSSATAGVTVVVSSGDAQASIRIDCSLPVAPVPSPTRPGGVTGPDTGNGGYLGQDSSASFPLWTLVALALGSVALVAGGVVTRKVTR